MQLMFGIKSFLFSLDQSGDINQLNVSALRQNLPSAPRVCRQEEMEQKAPHNPPFQARLYNVPYEAGEEQIRTFLGSCRINRVFLTERSGTAIVDFQDRESLITSFQFNNQILINRSVRVDLNENRGGSNRGGPNRGFYDSMGGNDRQRGSYDNYNQRGGGGGGRNNRRSQPFYQPYSDSGNGGMGGGRMGGDYQKPAYHDKPSRPAPLQLPSQHSQIQAVSQPPPALGQSATEAQKRVVDETALKNLLAGSGTKEASHKDSIFGNARPVDTASKEIEIEKRLETERQNLVKKSVESGSPHAEGKPRNSSTSSQSYPHGYDQQQQDYDYTWQQREGQRPDRSHLEKIAGPRGNGSQSGQRNQFEDKVQEQPEQQAPAKLVVAPPPPVNPWNKSAATVSAVTKEVTVNKDAHFAPPPYQDYGDQYTSAGAAYPYREDEEPQARGRQDSKKTQTLQDAPLPPRPAWGGAGISASLAQPQQAPSSVQPRYSMPAPEQKGNMNAPVRSQGNDQRRSYPAQQQQAQRGNRREEGEGQFGGRGGAMRNDRRGGHRGGRTEPRNRRFDEGDGGNQRYNRGSGNRGGYRNRTDEDNQRERYGSTSSSHRDRVDSHTGEDEGDGWNVAGKGRGKGTAPSGRSSVGGVQNRGKPRPQSNYESGNRGGHNRDTKPRDGGKYGSPRGGAKSGDRGGRDRNFAQGGHGGERSYRNDQRSGNRTTNSQNIRTAKEGEFKEAKAKKSTRPERKDVVENEGQTFTNANKFGLLDEHVGEKKDSQKSQQKLTKNDYFEEEDMCDEEEEIEIYEEVEEEEEETEDAADTDRFGN